jgi:hypothetical protein
VKNNSNFTGSTIVTISNKPKQQMQFYCVVAECDVFFRRKVVKLFGEIIIIYASISNRYNVKTIIAICFRVTLY